jgi:C4-dicarboxylate transporter, DctQ subunit
LNPILAPLRWLDRNAERVLILFAYSSMAMIIVYAVFERFVLRTQIPWSSSIPIYLFLWVTWIGCSHNVRKRTHLAFNDVRLRMSYRAQYACMWLDALLWIGFGAIVLYYTIEQTRLVEMNFAIVQGTDHVMQWWFYLATPLAWALLIVRVLQNLADDVRRWRRREPFLVDIQAIGGD